MSRPMTTTRPRRGGASPAIALSGALAGAVSSEQGHGLPLGKLDINAEQDLARPVEDVDIFGAEEDASAHDPRVSWRVPR